MEDGSRGIMPHNMLKMGSSIMQPSQSGSEAAVQRLSGRPKPSTEVNDIYHDTCIASQRFH